MEQTFDEKVQAMSAKEIIMAMVEGLRNPVVKINMSTFGEVDNNGICYGCAATNAICKISGVTFTANNIVGAYSKSEVVGSGASFLSYFETAIDGLRMGYLNHYNEYANEINIAQISNPNNIDLPKLEDDYTPEQLDIYVQLANDQEKQ